MNSKQLDHISRKALFQGMLDAFQQLTLTEDYVFKQIRLVYNSIIGKMFGLSPNQIGTARSFTGTSPNTQYSTEMQKREQGRKLGKTLCCLALGATIFNLGFIIPSLIYSYQGGSCVNTVMDGISFPLSTWLQVDAYTRIGLIALLLIIAAIACCSVTIAAALLTCAIVLLILYALFSLAWTIVGAVLFWGKLQPNGYCKGGVQIYMWIFLILSFIGICCNFFSGGLNRNKCW